MSHLANAAFLAVLLAVAPASGQVTGSPSATQESGAAQEVQVGAGTTTGTTTGSSGGSQTSQQASPGGGLGTGGGSGNGPTPPGTLLCEAYMDAAVRQHCIEKVAE